MEGPMTGKGRGWHGERGRHSLAARGLTTKRKPKPDARSLRIVKMALEKMRRTIRWLNPLFDNRGNTWQIDVRQQDKLTRELEDIIGTLKGIEFSAEMESEFEKAQADAETAWSYEERDRILYLEMARERLHNVIITYLDDRGEYKITPLDEEIVEAREI